MQGLSLQVVSLVCTLLLFPAQGLAAAEKKAARFVALMGYKEQYAEFYATCLRMNQAIPPAKLLEADDVLNPASKYWPEVEAAYERYFAEMCARPTEQEFLRTMARAYASQMTEAEIDKAIQYYSSSAGKKLVAAHKAAVRSVYVEWEQINAEYVPVATARLNRVLSALREAAVRETADEKPEASRLPSKGR